MNTLSDETIKNLAAFATEFWTGSLQRIIIVPPGFESFIEDSEFKPDYRLDRPEGVVLGFTHQRIEGSVYHGIVRVAALKQHLSEAQVPYVELVRRTKR